MLVGLSELSLTGDGYIPRVETMEATDDLEPFQVKSHRMPPLSENGQPPFGHSQEGSIQPPVNRDTDHLGLGIPYHVQ